jgi:ubiquinone/menaquinone biosynthesis C-methylase UbiE
MSTGRSQSKSVYDEIAPHYDRGIRHFERWFLSGLRRKLLAQLPADSSILELGAGTGLNFGYYPPRVHGAASEPSTEMLRIASTKLKPDGVCLVQSCAEQLPFRNGVFDAAFATLVFCSVTSPEQAFAEIRRVVKPGGTVLLLEHVRPKGLLGPLFDLMNLITKPLFGDNLNRRTAALAGTNGLKLIDVESRYLGVLNLISCRV